MLSDLRTELTRLCAGVPFATGLAADVGGERILLNAQRPFPAASLIKLGIAAYGHELWQRQQEMLTTQVVLQEADLVGGAGLLRLLTPKTYSVADLLTLMITVSDNTATNLLIARWGMLAINEWLTSHFPGAQLQRRLMDGHAAGDNVMTASAGLQLLQAALTTKDDYWQVVQRALRHQVSQIKLTYPLASGQFQGEWANKTGELGNVEHDAARLTIAGQRADCVLLTQFDAGQRKQAIMLQERVGQCLCTYLNS
jgi:beta-lactamase class A